MLRRTFTVTDTDTQAATIRATFKQRGELSAAMELRVSGYCQHQDRARECVRSVIRWKLLPEVKASDSSGGQMPASMV